MISPKDIAAQIPALFDLQPDVSKVTMGSVLQAEESEDLKKQQALEVSKSRMLALMKQGNYELVLRIIKSLYHDATMESVEAYAKSPEAFYQDVELLVKKESRDLSKFQNAYAKYKKSFDDHFRATMDEWEHWQLSLFQHQIEIVSVFLAYKTAEGAVTESTVIAELIHNLDPKQPDIANAVVLLQGKRREDLFTAGFLGVLAIIGALFVAKKAK